MNRVAVFVTGLMLVPALFGKAVTAQGSGPVVSPDGKRVLYMSDGPDGPALHLINADGTSDVTIRKFDKGNSPGKGVWSTDGKRILFARVVRDTVRVSSLSADGSQFADLGVIPAPGARSATIAANGLSVVYGAGPCGTMQLYSATLDGKIAKQLTVPNTPPGRRTVPVLLCKVPLLYPVIPPSMLATSGW